jgi:hypothetical protein
MAADVAGANLETMMSAMADAQATQAAITSEKMKHDTIMNLLQAIQDAFAKLKG